MGTKMDLSVLVELTTEEELLEVVELLKESDLVTDLELDTTDMAVAIGVFMKAVEAVPVADEDNLPTEASELYNKFSDKLAQLLSEQKKGKEKGNVAAKNGKAAPKEETKKPVAKAAKAPAKEKAAPKEKAAKPAKAEKTEKAEKANMVEGEFREGTSAHAILMAVRDAGKKGITREQIVEDLDGKIVTNSVPGRVKKILLSCLKKGLATKNEAGVYFSA